MLALLSPAKTLDPAPAPSGLAWTVPALLDDAALLVARLRGLDAPELVRLMAISSPLAALNQARFQDWSPPFTPANAKQAALFYRGDTYKGLDADTLTPDDWTFAQERLAILSGLYGLLRPLDLIQPYRLEMGTALANPRGRDLYAFWGERLAVCVNQRVADHADATVINLASEEYARAVPRPALRVPLLTPVFKEFRQGRYQVIGLMAKRARGAMARFLVRNRLQRPEPLQGFSEGGYCFRSDLSNQETWVFTRGEAA